MGVVSALSCEDYILFRVEFFFLKICLLVYSLCGIFVVQMSHEIILLCFSSAVILCLFSIVMG